MKIGGMSKVSSNVSPVREQAMKTTNVGDTHTKEANWDTISRADWNVSDSFIKKAVDKANESMVIQNRFLEFRIHEKTNEIIVRIIDSNTKEVIREIPSEKILDMFASMLELAGLMVDERR